MLDKGVIMRSENNRAEINICTIFVGLSGIVLRYIRDKRNVERVRNITA